MLQSLYVMPTPTVKTPWAHSFAPVKLVLPEMVSIVLVRKTWKKPVVLDSESSQLPLFLFIAYLRCPTKRNSVTAKIKTYVTPDFVQQFA